MGKTSIAAVLTATAWVAMSAVPAGAETVMQQCGQQYQAAKAAGTLNGMSWNQYRVDCSARLKATPASATAPAAEPAAMPAANPLKPAAPAATTAATPAAAPAVPASPPASTAAAPASTASGKPMSAGRVAFVARERQCGAEWKANKPTLVAQTPGLTWPKYLSQCNARLKSAGQ